MEFKRFVIHMGQRKQSMREAGGDESYIFLNLPNPKQSGSKSYNNPNQGWAMSKKDNLTPLQLPCQRTGDTQ